MKEDKNFFIVDKSVLPEIFLKVMEVKNLLESKKEKTVQDAVNRVGANILTINQTIPINGIANVTITIETNEMQGEFGRLMTQLENLQGMQSIKIIGRE